MLQWAYPAACRSFSVLRTWISSCMHAVSTHGRMVSLDILFMKSILIILFSCFTCHACDRQWIAVHGVPRQDHDVML
jgi:hypothetical protein